MILRPDGTVVTNPADGAWSVYTLVGGGTIATAWADEDDATRTLNSSTGNCGAMVTVDSMPQATSIVKFSVAIRYYISNAGRIYPFISIGGTIYYSETDYFDGPIGAVTEASVDWLINPDTGVPFIDDDINDDAFLIGTRTFTTVGGHYIYTYFCRGDVTFYPDATGTKMARDNGSRRARVFRRQTSMVSMAGNILLADPAPFDVVNVQARSMPSPDGLGWGAKKWQRGSLTMLGGTFNPNTMRVTRDAIDNHQLATRLWDTQISDEDPSAEEPGVALLTPGAGRTFTRDSFSYIESAASASQGICRVVRVPAGERKICFQGTLYEEERTNELLYSAFIDELTGWTTAGTAVNGSAIESDTTRLFDPDITAFCMKMTCGNPHAADLSATSTATAAYDADSIIFISIDHTEDAGETLDLVVTRGVDGFYYTGAAWQAAAASFTMPNKTVLDGNQRYILGPVDVGGNATTITVAFVAPSGGTASRIYYVHFAQIEEGDCASSRMVTNDSSFARDADQYVIENNAGYRVWADDRHTCGIFFTPEWNSADLAVTQNKILFTAFDDGTNYATVYYSKNLNAIVYYLGASGTGYYVYRPCVLLRGVKYRIGFRKTSSEEELDLSANTIDVFVDATKGVSYGPSGNVVIDAYVPVADADVYVGCYYTLTNQADGFISDLDIVPLCLPDEEMVDFP